MTSQRGNRSIRGETKQRSIRRRRKLSSGYGEACSYKATDTQFCRKSKLTRLPAFLLDPRSLPHAESGSSSSCLFTSKSCSYHPVRIYITRGDLETTLNLPEPCTSGKQWQSSNPTHSLEFWEMASCKLPLFLLACRKLNGNHLAVSAKADTNDSPNSHFVVLHATFLSPFTQVKPGSKTPPNSNPSSLF